MTQPVRIVFELEQDQDGHPPEKWEGIWAEPLGNGRFKLDNVPFFVRGISCDDVVRATLLGKELRFQELLEPSDNSTIRVIVYDLDAVEPIRGRLRELGCDVEGTGIPGLLAVNIPSVSFDNAMQVVREGFERDLWDFEEGAVRAR